MALNVADLFCGTGGFSHGFAQTGDYKTVLGVEIRDASIATFKANHPGALAICEDIRNVSLRSIADQLEKGAKSIDILIGGPPCQGFSSIRPFRSINEDDKRNNLFEQYVLFVDFFKPKFIVFENVVGLLHHKSGETITQIRQVMESLGYATDMAVLNAVHFGVPQKRERVVILGRRGKTAPWFPSPTHFHEGRGMGGKNTITPSRLFDKDLRPAITVQDAISDLPAVVAGESADSYKENGAATSYTTARRKGQRILTLHSATKHTPRMLEIIKSAGKNRWALPEGMTTSGFSSCYSRLDADEPSTTITVNFVHPASNRCIHPTQNRALTVREGARLQGFDDDFVFCGSRTEIVKQIGEAVPPLLGNAIALAILEGL